MAAKTDGKERVLLTGGTGFIASHILDCLLEHGFHVVLSVRSTEKGNRILEATDPKFRCHVEFAIVGDVAGEGAFDHVFQESQPFDFIVHTASPYHLNVQDPVKDFLDPAIKGTTGILRSAAAHAPTVRRVVLTSSSAAIQNPRAHPAVYDESCWAPWTSDDAVSNPQFAYAASKALAEKAAWDIVSKGGASGGGGATTTTTTTTTTPTSFDLVTINNTYTFGPLQRTLTNVDEVNTSNHRVRDMVLGRMRDGLQPTAPVFTFVDVRDVALAHVRALTVPEAGGKRFYVVGGHFSNRRIADAIRGAFPHLRDRIPAAASDEDGAAAADDDLPADVYGFDNSRSRDLLGLEYRELGESVVDTVRSIEALRQREEGGPRE